MGELLESWLCGSAAAMPHYCPDISSEQQRKTYWPL